MGPEQESKKELERGEKRTSQETKRRKESVQEGRRRMTLKGNLKRKDLKRKDPKRKEVAQKNLHLALTLSLRNFTSPFYNTKTQA